MLIHRLALRLGKSLDELENEMDEDELYRWMVFDAIEPVGDKRQDTLAAFICTSAHGGKPSDFLPQWDHWIGEAETSDGCPVPDAQTVAQIQQERDMIAFKAAMFKLIKERGGDLRDHAISAMSL